MEPSHRSKFYHQRHMSAAGAYLHRYKYLLLLDADNLIFNLSRPLTEALHLPLSLTEGPDVILHMRDGGEAAASSYLLRNSPYARRFLEWWRDMAPPLHLQSVDPSRWISTPNHDNGDLVSLLMILLHNEVYLRCLSHIKPVSPHVSSMEAYDRGVLLCFRLFRGAFAEEAQRKARGLHRRLPQVQLLFTRESFLTMHTGHLWRESSGGERGDLLQRVAQRDGLSYPLKDVMCASNDIIGHGMKSIGSVYWSNMTCDVESILRGHGANEVCQWFSKEEELFIARHYCFWRSPICRGSPEEGNICINFMPPRVNSSNSHEQRITKCDLEKFNMQRWSLCVNHDICNPYITYRHFQRNITGSQAGRRKSIHEIGTPWIT